MKNPLRHDSTGRCKTSCLKIKACRNGSRRTFPVHPVPVATIDPAAANVQALTQKICRLIVSAQMFLFSDSLSEKKTQQKHHWVYQPMHHISFLLPEMLIVAGMINAQRQIKVSTIRHAQNSQGHISDVPPASPSISRHFNHLSAGS